MKRLLGHIYFVYGILLFLVSMLFVLPPILWIRRRPEPARSRALHRIFRGWMGLFMPLVFCPVRRRGEEHFDGRGPCVVVANHNSLVDIPVTSPWIPGPNKTLAKVEMARIPLFGIIYTAGSILVDRKQARSRRESMQRMQDTLDQGIHLCLYPEGTRNKTEKPLLPFYDGAFVAAIKAQRPIIPALIFHTGAILPHDRPGWAWPHRIHLHFLPPIETRGLGLDDLGPLKEMVHSQMESYYIQHKISLS